MARVVFLLPAMLFAAACVDGTTPDCTSVTSGCYPGDSGGTTPDASNASDASDASKAPDAPTD